MFHTIGSEIHHFYVGFVPLFGLTPSIALLTNKNLINYSIEAPVTGFYQNGTAIANVMNTINLPNTLTGPSYNYPNSHNDDYKEGVYLQTTGDKISVIGQIGQDAMEYNFDTFFAIPVKDFCISEYTYFALSVSTNVDADGSVVIVGTANQTTLNISVPVSAVIKINNSASWSSLNTGILYSYEIQRLQIVYIAAYTTDLTGTKVTTNKPISFFSGHECAFIPYYTWSCDLLMEQIPHTGLWGRIYYFAPLATRKSYTIKIIAAYDSTNVDIYCNNVNNHSVKTTVQHVINAGKSIDMAYNNQKFCGVYANKEVLVAQFSHGYRTDLRGDPMMTLIPATTHYTNSITSSTFQTSSQNSFYNHFINIIVLANYYQPQMISITTTEGVTQSLHSQIWVPIFRNNVVDAYAAQVNMPYGVFEVTHSNKSALMTVVVYGFAKYLNTSEKNYFEGYGHPGWLMDHLNDGKYI